MIQQCISTFLMLPPFNTVPHIVVTANHNIISLLFQNINFAIIVNCNVDIWFVTLQGAVTRRWRTLGLEEKMGPNKMK